MASFTSMNFNSDSDSDDGDFVPNEKELAAGRYAHLTHFSISNYEGKPLFVFSKLGPKQNAGSLLTPVSDTVFYALSHGTLGFALHGSSLNHFLIGGNSSTANQIV